MVSLAFKCFVTTFLYTNVDISPVHVCRQLLDFVNPETRNNKLTGKVTGTPNESAPNEPPGGAKGHTRIMHSHRTHQDHKVQSPPIHNKQTETAVAK